MSPTKRRGRAATDTVTDDTVEAGGSTPSRGRGRPPGPSSPRKSVRDLSPEAEIRPSRRSGRFVNDADKDGHYQCPYCDYVDATRAGRNVHLRNEHPGMKMIKKEVEEEECGVVVQPAPTPRLPSKPSGAGRRSRGRPTKRTSETVVDIMTTSPTRHAPSPKRVQNVGSNSASPRRRANRTISEIDSLAEQESLMEFVEVTESQEVMVGDLSNTEDLEQLEEEDVKPPPVLAQAQPRKSRGRPKNRSGNERSSDPSLMQHLYRGPAVETETIGVEDEHLLPLPIDEADEEVVEETIEEGDFLEQELIEEEIVDDNMQHQHEESMRPRRSGARKNYAALANAYGTIVRGGNLEEHHLDERDDYSSGSEFDEIDVTVDNEDAATEFAKHVTRMEHEPGYNLQPRMRPSRHNPLGDPHGRYPCYIEGCKWRGNFRSVRCTHMRNSHPDWVRPPRFVLNRIAADGTILPANDANARYACFIEGCPWRGNYRASRSNHMKTQHKGWIPKRTRAANGGYVPNGRYHCHVEECGWRGMSRSTRAVHMRREHPGFINPIYTPRNIPCTDCGASMTSHKLFVDHMVVEHKIGGIVQREFTDVRDYEDWFEAVQDSFSIDFIKKMGVKNGPNYQILYLYCARSGGYCPSRGYDKKLDPMGLYEPRHAKQRKTAKCGKNCAAFLRVMHWNDGRLSIIGCVEHTGHRLGTALLRLSPIEREAMDEYLYMMDENTPLDYIIDRLRDIEAFTADGYQPDLHPPEFIQQFVTDGSERVSLVSLLQNAELFTEATTFNVVPPNDEGLGMSIGVMDDVMKELWREHASKGVCIEEVRLVLNTWDLHVFLVLVLDAKNCPRIAAFYISHDADKEPLLKQLTSVWEGHVDTFVTDCAEEYPGLLEKFFGRFNPELDLQMAEWHLLAEWASNVDLLVANRVDKYGVICVLRRLLRTTDAVVFEQTVNELFEGLREMQLDEVAQFIDNQLDPALLKRWSPLARNPLTEHNNPTLEYACRMLRDRFMSCEQCTRIDEYVGLLLQRVKEYNEAELSAIYATREPDPPRELPHIYVQEAMEAGDELHHLEEDEQENWAELGQRAGMHGQPRFQGLSHHPHPRYMHIESTNQALLDKCATAIGGIVGAGASTSQDKLPQEMLIKNKNEPLDGGQLGDIIEEVVEEEIVEFEDAEMINQLVEDGEFIMEDDELGGGMPRTGRAGGDKRQKLYEMMAMLQEKLETMADDESIELVEGSLEQVVNKLNRTSPRKL